MNEKKLEWDFWVKTPESENEILGVLHLWINKMGGFLDIELNLKNNLERDKIQMHWGALAGGSGFWSLVV